MKTWAEVVEVYRSYLNHPMWKRSAERMLRLIDNLRLHPELSMVYRSTAMDSAGEMDGLLLWLPQARRIVQVRCDTSSDFAVFYCHDTQETPTSSREAIDVIREHLRHSNN